MKLLTFSLDKEKTKLGGLLESGYVVDLQRSLGTYLIDMEGVERGREIASALIPNDMTEFIQGGSRALEAAKIALEYGSQREQEFLDHGILIPEPKITYWAPVTKPAKIICAGGNFSEQLEDRGVSVPEVPVGFIKVQSALVGHKCPVILKENMQLVDYEVELAVIIGKRVENISKENALDCVLGYSVFNDISERSIQRKEMSRGSVMAGKNFDTFAPIGPYLFTKDEVRNPCDLNLKLKVNGAIRQDSNTKNMILDVPTLISYWSSVMTLEPGDIITTGTPGGVAMTMKPDPMPFYLKLGDIMEAEIEGLGTLTNPIMKK